MAGIQLIVPLDDEEDSLEKKSTASTFKKVASESRSQATADSKMEEEQKEGDADAHNSEKSSSSGVLSDELREQFETMKAVWRRARRPSADENDDSKTDSSNAAQQQEEEEEELRRKQRETAVETALVVDAEISRWHNGIAELEAMLAADEGASDSEASSLQEEQGQGEEQFQNQGQQHERLRQRLLQHQNQPYHHPVIQFPNLPPVVPEDDYDSSDAS